MNMVDIQYANAYTEVLEILKNISQEEYNKVPKKRINLFEHNANKEYIFNYDSNKTLEEQNVSKTARAIIAILFRDYWATDEQRDRIKTFQNNKRQQIEEENRTKYNTDIFKNKTYIDSESKFEQTENMQLVQYKENIFKKILSKIKNIFSRK